MPRLFQFQNRLFYKYPCPIAHNPAVVAAGLTGCGVIDDLHFLRAKAVGQWTRTALIGSEIRPALQLTFNF